MRSSLLCWRRCVWQRSRPESLSEGGHFRGADAERNCAAPSGQVGGARFWFDSARRCVNHRVIRTALSVSARERHCPHRGRLGTGDFFGASGAPAAATRTHREAAVWLLAWSTHRVEALRGGGIIPDPSDRCAIL